MSQPEIPRLTPAPLHLLVAMARGACMRRYDSVSPFFLIRPPGPHDEFEFFQRLHARAPRTLIKFALVEPIDRFDWRVSAAGHAWLASNGIAAKSEKDARPLVTFRGE
ncbi:hypothetical protein [Bradyrhizobium diazoefficiens]|uniref:hypothetical protein n=1 Tax=Bradyrhizobium diazoefficiens TaxID=1355477 RepID=UPI000577834E|nr:hypothetical protein [Bradyrhizobium diazoefficiens]